MARTVGEGCTEFWWGNWGGGGHLEDPDVDMRITVKWIFKKYDVAAWSGLIWLTTGTIEGLF